MYKDVNDKYLRKLVTNTIPINKLCGPLFAVALSYSVQIVEEGVIPVTPSDVFIDALISPSGFIPISPVAQQICHSDITLA